MLEVCYFCPEQVDKETIIDKVAGGEKGWQVLVIENKYPAVTQDNARAFGKQEVIIETPLHRREIHELSVEKIVKILDVYNKRYDAIKKIDGIKYIIVFKNEGGKAGASISHSHSQIIALPLIPPEIEREYQAYAKYEVENGGCPYCDIIQKEQHKSRVVMEDDHFFVLCPYASQSPYAVWFLPKRHINHMTDMSKDEKESLAKALKKVLGKLDEIDVAYNYFFHNAVYDEDYHMHLKLSPRPNVWAGLELGTGVIINSVAPEDAARFYRR